MYEASKKGEAVYLGWYYSTLIRQTNQVKFNKSSYKNQLLYSSYRLANDNQTFKWIEKLIRKQQRVCDYCAKPFYVWNNIERHHIKELAKDGAMTKINLSVVQKVCHHKRHNMTKLEIKDNNKSWEAHLARSRMKGDFHVRFWSRVVSREWTSTIISSHPEAEEGFKGTAVRRLKWNVSWV